MSRVICPDPRWAAINPDGTPCAGAQLFVYDAGTDTLVTLTNPDGGAVLPNPLTANERGYFPVFTVNNGATYKIKITTPSGVVISQINSYTV